jgi:hypothetical protein
MVEVKKEIKTFMVYAMCGCGGKYEPANIQYDTLPPQYLYTCNKCGDRKIFNDSYPKITYEEV